MGLLVRKMASWDTAQCHSHLTALLIIGQDLGHIPVPRGDGLDVVIAAVGLKQRDGVRSPKGLGCHLKLPSCHPSAHSASLHWVTAVLGPTTLVLVPGAHPRPSSCSTESGVCVLLGGRCLPLCDSTGLQGGRREEGKGS